MLLGTWRWSCLALVHQGSATWVKAPETTLRVLVKESYCLIAQEIYHTLFFFFFCLVQQKLLYAPRVPAYGSSFEVESQIKYFVSAVQLKSLLLISKVFVWNLDVAQTCLFIKWKE